MDTEPKSEPQKSSPIPLFIRERDTDENGNIPIYGHNKGSTYFETQQTPIGELGLAVLGGTRIWESGDDNNNCYLIGPHGVETVNEGKEYAKDNFFMTIDLVGTHESLLIRCNMLLANGTILTSEMEPAGDTMSTDPFERHKMIARYWSNPIVTETETDTQEILIPAQPEILESLKFEFIMENVSLTLHHREKR